MIDVLVVGGGPIGLATAIGARLAGLDVAIAEPRTGAIDKACGEGLMPDALASLAVLGVDPPGADLRGIRYVQGRRSVEAPFAGPPGRGVRRLALHEALRDRAEALAIPTITERVDAIEQSADGIRAAGIQARYLVGADGLHSRVRRLLGRDVAFRGRRRYGLRQHYAVEPWTSFVEVYWLPSCEVYVTPVSGDCVGVAVLGEELVDVGSVIDAVPQLRTRLAGGVPAGPPRGAGPLRQRTSARTRGRAMLVGDAAGYVDALTGEGLRVGFAEADAAIRAVVNEDLPGYEDEWRRITRSYRRMTWSLLEAASHPWSRAMIVPAAQRLPGVFTRIVDGVAYSR